jgi:excisionase family DNA binding protein
MIERKPQHSPSASIVLDSRPAWVDELFDELAAIRDVLSGRLKSHMTIDEVAESVGRTPYTVRRWISEGRIVATRVQGTGPRGRLLVSRSELDRLIHEGLGGSIAATAVSPDMNTDGELKSSVATHCSR